MISPYFSDKDLISSLRKYYSESEAYIINFSFWLHTAKKIEDGIIIQIASRIFLVDYYTGSVIKEVL